jgi:membrane-associated protease RseP (regulator of RpoE activity)
MGARLARNFEQNMPPFSDNDFEAVLRFLDNPETLLAGLPFSVTLLTILLAHELGHYFACVHYRVDASLPYFLPAPTLIGTFGAFIRIRSPIYSRPMLFDIGIAGPLAGFLFLLPAFAIGLAYSKIIPGIASQGDFIFGVPLLQRALEAVIFPGTAATDIYLHPVARAAWVGILATALNLLPIGQLDGGHILYSFVGVWHKTLSRLFAAALIPIGFIYSYTWLLWALFLFLFGMRHPMIYDTSPLQRGRRRLGLLALIIFLLSFTLAPVSLGEGVL